RSDGCEETVAAFWRHPKDRASGPNRVKTMGPVACDGGVETSLDVTCGSRVGRLCFANRRDACACICSTVEGASADVDGCNTAPEIGSLSCAKAPASFW